MSAVLKRIEAVISARQGDDDAVSYVATLFAKGEGKIAEKVGEEAIETVIAAVSGTTEELTSEAADLLFHLLILLRARGVSLSDVEAELARREGISGLEEKAARKT